MTMDVLRRTHRWIGLLIALPVALLGISGTILALAELFPDQPATPAPPRSVGTIVAAVQDWAGTDARATRYIAPRANGYVARVEIATEGGPSRSVRVDPTALTILGADPPGGGMLGWVRSLHVQFLAAAYGGRSIGGWCGIGLLVMLVTAVPVWWPRDGRVKQAFTADFRATGTVFHRRLHGAAGAWIISVVLILTVTGIAMAFPRTVRGTLGLEQRGPSRAVAVKTEPPISPATIDRVIGLTQQAVPDAALRLIFLPPRAADAMRLVFYRFGQSGAVNAIQVQVDMAAGTIRTVDDPETRKLADSLYRWMHDLHTASGIGDWWRIIASIAGAGLPLLSVTGLVMWWRKRSTRRRTTHPRPADTRRPAVSAE